MIMLYYVFRDYYKGILISQNTPKKTKLLKLWKNNAIFSLIISIILKNVVNILPDFRNLSTGNTMPRERIDSILEKALKYPLVYVEAGTGYGKSVAVNDYMEKHDLGGILLQINPLDNVPEQFWSKYTEKIKEQNEALAVELKKLGFPVTAEDFADYFRIILGPTSRKEKCFFILDNFHYITNSQILIFIENIIYATLATCSIIILSASESKLNFPELKRSRLMAEIKAKDLAFTKEEIRRYSSLNDLPLDEETLDKVIKDTDGWPLAVNMIIESLLQGNSLKEAKASVIPQLLSLLDIMLMKKYTEEIRAEVVKLAFLPQSSPMSLVRSVVKLPSTELLYFVIDNPFVRFDTKSDVVRLQSVFHKLLKARVVMLSQEEINKVNVDMARWYADNDETVKAVELCIESEHYDYIKDMFGTLKTTRMTRKVSDKYLDLLEKIPDGDSEEHKMLKLHKANLLMNNLSLDEAWEVLDNLESETQNSRLLGEICLHKGLIVLQRRDFDFVDYFKKAEELLPEGSELIGSNYALMDINNGITTKTLMPEDIEEMLSCYQNGMPYLEKVTDGCGAGVAAFYIGEYAFLRGELLTAERYFYTSLMQAHTSGQYDVELNAIFMLIRVNLAVGRSKQAMEYFKKLQAMQQEAEQPHVKYPTLDLALAWVYIRLGYPQKSAPWIYDFASYKQKITPIGDGRNHCIHIEWLMAERRYTEAAAYVEVMEARFTDTENPFLLVNILIQKFLILNAIKGDINEKKGLLERVYFMLKDAKLHKILVEYGEPIRSAFMGYSKLENRKIPDDWTAMIIRKSHTNAKYFNEFKRLFSEEHNVQRKTNLTGIERDIMENLCQGLSRKEISETLNISENTIKSYLNNIYKKLGAITLNDAVYRYTLQKLSDEQSE